MTITVGRGEDRHRPGRNSPEAWCPQKEWPQSPAVVPSARHPVGMFQSAAWPNQQPIVQRCRNQHHSGRSEVRRRPPIGQTRSFAVAGGLWPSQRGRQPAWRDRSRHRTRNSDHRHARCARLRAPRRYRHRRRCGTDDRRVWVSSRSSLNTSVVWGHARSIGHDARLMRGLCARSMPDHVPRSTVWT